MKRIKRGGLGLAVFLALLVVLAVGGQTLLSRLISNRDYASGWGLFLSLFALMALSIRKTLPGLPLGPVKGWLNFHICFGVVSVALFVNHAGLSAPSFEPQKLLWRLYIIVNVAGVLAAVISRRAPKRLIERGRNVIYEQAPVLYQNYRKRSEAVMLAAASAPHGKKVVDFYLREMFAFFTKPRNQWRYMLGSIRACQPMLDDLERLKLEVDGQAVKTLDEFAALIESKDALDFQYANQRLVKLSILFHEPLVYGLLVFASAHAALAYEFGLN